MHNFDLAQWRAILAALVVLFIPLQSVLQAQSIYSTPYHFTTFAGNASRGSSDGSGSAARFSFPSFLVLDHARNVYVSDGYNHTIRKITPAGIVTTFAGQPGVLGSTDGIGLGARFSSPTGLVFDPNGNLYVAESSSGMIRRINPAGEVTTVTHRSGPVADRFSPLRWPWGLTIDQSGNLLVAELGNHTIRKIAPSGEMIIVAGMIGLAGRADGVGAMARFDYPAGIAIDVAGNLFVADSRNHAIRRITPQGAVTTFAGSLGQAGNIDAVGGAARFNGPTGVAIDSLGFLYVADGENATIRRISPSAVVTTLAGAAGTIGRDDGPGGQAKFFYPVGVALDTDQNIWVGDSENNSIRRSIFPSIIRLQPAIQNVTPGETIAISANMPGESSLRYQWHVGGIALAGATSPTLTLNAVAVENAGNYAVTVTGEASSAVSDAATVRVISEALTARLSNVSVRARINTGETLTVGVAVADGSRDILIRGVGPALALLGVTAPVLDPRLELFSGNASLLMNDDWPAPLSSLFSTVGAFPLPPSGRDAAFARSLSGPHSVQARATGPGVVLVEAYAVGDESASRLSNVSVRHRVGAGDDVLVAGFTITGTGPKQLLLRAVGPGLAGFGVSGILENPKLELYNSAAKRIAENDDWPSSLAPTFERAGAFPLTPGFSDSALLTAVLPGSYSLHVKGADGGTGEALIEIYELR